MLEGGEKMSSASLLVCLDLYLARRCVAFASRITAQKKLFPSSWPGTCYLDKHVHLDAVGGFIGSLAFKLSSETATVSSLTGRFQVR
jgi:hypothetical protein